jgi:phenylalanyl-tRNA synthetase beta chain
VTPELARRFDLDSPPAVAEVELSVLVGAKHRERHYRPLPRFPAVRRDLSLTLDESVKWADLARVVSLAAERLEELRFESLFRGKGLPAGKKALAFAMRLRAPDRSLTDAEANQIRDQVLSAIQREFPGATPR